jgi:hypothetical protein
MPTRYPEADTPASMEGDAAHWVACREASGQVTALGAAAPNGLTVSDEMAEGAEIYADHLRSLRSVCDERGWALERRLSCAVVHPDNWGTPDALGYEPATNTLHVVDYKFGHRFVAEFENWQLIDYAAGALVGLQGNGINAQSCNVALHIVQPRNYHRDGPIRTWRTTAAELAASYIPRLMTAATAAMRDDAPCVTGPECDYCPGRHACEAAQRAGFAACEISTGSLPLEMPPEAAARELALLQRAADMIEARRTGLVGQLLAACKAGVRVPGFHAEQGLGRERWARPLPEVLALGQMLEIDLAKPGAITPKQAIKAGVPAEVVQAYSETPLGEIKLVSDGTRLSTVFGRAA